MEDVALEVKEKQSSKKKVVYSCNEYGIIVSWICCDMQQITEDLASEEQREKGIRSCLTSPGIFLSIPSTRSWHCCYLAVCKQILQDIIFLKIPLLTPQRSQHHLVVSHHVRPTQPQDNLNKGKSRQSSDHFSNK
ncbi:hypothetical protein KY290_005675 [Solanum tuberosum]|uniref:Uncharacterized protein n=1 Tax=Solanum tuberosum TaxID=4113 RepID=A0ABQ7WGN0_SOLTU|nr:hypothetical protein KY289_006053 [Solanum tuberosum]KAH0779248.1 hypothetical protein KY290_005675 [Solanum tuberosum]